MKASAGEPVLVRVQPAAFEAHTSGKNKLARGECQRHNGYYFVGALVALRPKPFGRSRLDIAVLGPEILVACSQILSRFLPHELVVRASMFGDLVSVTPHLRDA